MTRANLKTTIETSRPDIMGIAATAILGGAIAGALDLIYATARTVLWGGDALRPWKGVAGALLGAPAMAGGNAMVALGVAIHFLIAIGGAAAFVGSASRLPWIVRYPVLSGAAFGAALLVVMNYVILPLSMVGRPIYTGVGGLSEALLVHVVLVGLPIALVTARRARYFAS
ncbi:hypothetical protein NDN01_00295 [Sphingomonas sp. QA11]|uniref:hypothetical protein n=1 Tax=Sphingomonas sp. QA11 TaxID=2950605 RepID=UPI0023498E6F|nr:hypothetical protein [Sphingomonas sp. QA11]WCM27416.1 hypothetical protein NDN01_00295 [Sphingomonas sp. QA11]